jgi:putative PIN family toxin of toxin-antitoxin system
LIRAVVDTNIIVSGLLFGGLPSKVVNAAIDRRFIWVTSPYLIEELERVLGYKKFDLSEREVKILLTPLIEISEVIIPTTTVDIIERCPADNRVLECAVDGKCSFIVTGDRRDLLSIKKFHHIEIITAKYFLDKI